MGIIRTVLRIGYSGTQICHSPCMTDYGHWSKRSENNQQRNTAIKKQTEGQGNIVAFRSALPAMNICLFLQKILFMKGIRKKIQQNLWQHSGKKACKIKWLCYNNIEPWEGMGNALIQIFHLRD